MPSTTKIRPSSLRPTLVLMDQQEGRGILAVLKLILVAIVLQFVCWLASFYFYTASWSCVKTVPVTREVSMDP